MLAYPTYLILGQTKERVVLMDVDCVRMIWSWITYVSRKEPLKMELAWLAWSNACLKSQVIH